MDTKSETIKVEDGVEDDGNEDVEDVIEDVVDVVIINVVEDADRLVIEKEGDEDDIVDSFEDGIKIEVEDGGPDDAIEDIDGAAEDVGSIIVEYGVEDEVEDKTNDEIGQTFVVTKLKTSV